MCDIFFIHFQNTVFQKSAECSKSWSWPQKNSLNEQSQICCDICDCSSPRGRGWLAYHDVASKNYGTILPEGSQNWRVGDVPT